MSTHRLIGDVEIIVDPNGDINIVLHDISWPSAGVIVYVRRRNGDGTPSKTYARLWELTEGKRLDTAEDCTA